VCSSDLSDHKEIVDAWGLYFSHLKTDQGSTPDSQKVWNDKSNTLFADLLHLMAKDLNISFSKTDIIQPSYYPRGYELTEDEQQQLRRLLLELLKNERSINMNATIFSAPNS
jgi:outer membrane lipoprotein-sorting protein